VFKEDFASQRDYPVRCPYCGDLTGYPTTVQTVRSSPGRLRIDIHCQACKEQWFEEVNIEFK